MDDAKIREALKRQLPQYEVAPDDEADPGLEGDSGQVDSRAGGLAAWKKSSVPATSSPRKEPDESTRRLLEKFAKREL